MQNYISNEIQEASDVMAKMAADHALLTQIEQAAQACVTCLRGGCKILLAGNGGSAADAQHIAAELVGRFLHERKGLAAIALTTDSSVLTALGNDYGYDRLFARQIEALGREGDIFIGYTTSGRSTNILEGLKQANQQGLHTIILTGNHQGVYMDSLQSMTDYLLQTPSKKTPKIQEGHLVMGHILAGLIEKEIFSIS